MHISGYFKVARQWWLALAAATVLSGAAGYVFAAQSDPVYESGTRLLIGPVSSFDIEDLRVAGQLASTYAELATGEALLATAIEGVPVSLQELRGSVRARGNSETRVLTLSVRLADPQLAATVADRLGAALQALVAAPPGSPGALQVIAPAQVPIRPIAPQIPLTAALAAAAGFVAAVVIVLLIDYYRDIVRGREDLEGLTNLPLIGSVPVPRRQPPSVHELVGGLGETDSDAGYRRLATSLVAGQRGAAPSILVVGTTRDDRSPDVALNIALAVAASGIPTTLVDADSLERGVTSWMPPDQSEPSAAPSQSGAYRLLDGRLEVIPYRPAGFTERPREELRRMLDALAESGRAVVVSSGALAHSPAAIVWATQCEATVVIALRETTRRYAVSDAVNSLRLLGSPLSGIVLAEPSRGAS